MTNTGIAACAAHPPACKTVLAGTAATAGVIAVVWAGSALLDHLHAPAGGQDAGRADQAAAVDAVSARIAQPLAQGATGMQEPGLQRALLQIARQCGGQRQCRADAINQLLRQLPPDSQTLLSLLAMVQATTGAPEIGWPSPVQAAAMESGQWEYYLGELVDLLADMYTDKVAAFQVDLETLAWADRSADPVRANADRLSQIEELLKRDGFEVTRQPYSAPAGAVRGVSLPDNLFNLHVVLRAGRGPRLLLVAHGDLTGIESGSQGAYDNGSGVAALLHVARQLASHSSGEGQVELLITSHEELGLLGSRGHVSACRQAGNCADAIINIDMVGRGGHGYLLSDTDAVADYNNRGQPPHFLNSVTGTGAAEAQLKHSVQREFAAHGFTRHLPDARYMMTSDNLAFQNHSLPCVGLMQADAQGAQALWSIDQARARWVDASRQIDWQRSDQARTGAVTISEQERAQLRAQIALLLQADEAYRQARHQQPRAPVALIHSGKDRVECVNPQMAVAFADALLAVARQWCDAPAG